jgi:D-3-phosphoglycerate dehydrogenase
MPASPLTFRCRSCRLCCLRCRNLYQTGAYKGCYVADFPEKGLKDESRCIFMPHLGASTEEAEENSASMAADEVKDYIEHGIIRNSVNFPETALPPRGSAIRLAVVNKNESGVLGNLNSLIANHGLNIMASVNNSRGDIAYTVVDIDSGTNVDMEALTDEIFGVSGVISTRFLTGEPGRHFRTNSGEPFFHCPRPCHPHRSSS